MKLYYYIIFLKTRDLLRNDKLNECLIISF